MTWRSPRIVAATGVDCVMVLILALPDDVAVLLVKGQKRFSRSAARHKNQIAVNQRRGGAFPMNVASRVLLHQIARPNQLAVGGIQAFERQSRGTRHTLCRRRRLGWSAARRRRHFRAPRFRPRRRTWNCPRPSARPKAPCRCRHPAPRKSPDWPRQIRASPAYKLCRRRP